MTEKELNEIPLDVFNELMNKCVKRHLVLEEIKDTQRQISLTKSKQRKYELHRHLDKLWKKYRKE